MCTMIVFMYILICPKELAWLPTGNCGRLGRAGETHDLALDARQVAECLQSAHRLGYEFDHRVVR